MAPYNLLSAVSDAVTMTKRQEEVPMVIHNGHPRSAATLDGNILEAWSEGLLVGGLTVLVMITIANMRRGVLLHKLILLEVRTLDTSPDPIRRIGGGPANISQLVMALPHGTFIFCKDPTYGWYLSSTAVFLYLSWYLHNIVAWIKNKPFLPRWGSRLYICSIIFVFPYWISEMFLNFNYFNGLGNESFERTRPWEALARDPWWIFTTCDLIYIIKREYNFGLFELIRASPRFGVLILSMFLSIVFLMADVVVTAAHLSPNDGINPYWKLSLVFKCAADALFLDDFKKVLDVLINHTLGKVGGQVHNANDPPPITDQRKMHDFGLQPVYTAQSGDSHGSGRKHSLYKPRSGSGSHRARRHTVFTLPKFGSSPRPGSNESFRSDDRFIQKPFPTRTSSSGRRPTVEWFDVMGDGQAEHVPGTATTIPMVKTEEVSPSAKTTPTLQRRGSDQSIDFVTSAI
ncbi:MAG: hypothetical protein M1837_000920 [Sclerophora amabilis]|nr:MAG: hypothetical protein M1837_000920 [Sclerophora amabilis]